MPRHGRVSLGACALAIGVRPRPLWLRCPRSSEVHRPASTRGAWGGVDERQQYDSGGSLTVQRISAQGVGPLPASNASTGRILSPRTIGFTRTAVGGAVDGDGVLVPL